MFGLTFEKLLLIGVIAVILIGPANLPRYASGLATMVRGLRRLLDTAKERVRDEMGPEFDEMDWKSLDPRQYDPRSIIRQALLNDDPEEAAPRTPVGTSPSAPRADEEDDGMYR
ncbi:Sec-independent protein translocase TatB [Lacisediminihabitans sp.]|uniref:Sec-independent protein translocase TatB n=1 Tax=Lacisediminihabitans sp. TaxID=2787631 RepID=UPI00374C934D